MMRRLVWEKLVFRSLVHGVRGFVLVGLALSLAGCGSSVRESLGFGKRAPDEFAVVKRQPLIIPPDYALRPPRPGAPSTAVASAEDRARAAMTGSEAAATGSGVTPAAAGVASAGMLTSTEALGPVSDEPATTSPASASPGQAALLAETGASATQGSGIREQIASEDEGRSRVAPAVFEQIIAEPGDSGPEAPEVVHREQTPIDVAE